MSGDSWLQLADFPGVSHIDHSKDGSLQKLFSVPSRLISKSRDMALISWHI